jgi:hypothetical protein
MPPKSDARKKVHFECSVSKYVDAVDPGFVTLLADVCLDGRLKSGGRRDGMTFLLPDYEGELYKKLFDLVYDPAKPKNGEGHDLASKLFLDKFMDEAAFKAAGGKAGDDGSVVWEGLTLVNAEKDKGGYDDTFKPSRNIESRVAVWIIKSGIPKSGRDWMPKPAPFKRGGDAMVTGNWGQSVGDLQSMAMRSAANISQGLSGDIVGRVVSFIRYADQKAPGYGMRLRMILDPNPFVSFCIIFRPSDIIDPDDSEVSSHWNLVSQWMAHGNTVGGGFEDYKSLMQDVQGYLARHPREIFQAIEVIRQQTDSGMASQAVTSNYAELWNNNRIGGVRPVFKDDIFEKLGNVNANAAADIDFARYRTTCLLYQSLSGLPEERPRAYTDAASAGVAGSFTSQAGSLIKSFYARDCIAFVRSTAFLYIAGLESRGAKPNEAVLNALTDTTGMSHDVAVNDTLP